MDGDRDGDECVGKYFGFALLAHIDLDGCNLVPVLSHNTCGVVLHMTIFGVGFSKPLYEIAHRHLKMIWVTQAIHLMISHSVFLFLFHYFLYFLLTSLKLVWKKSVVVEALFLTHLWRKMNFFFPDLAEVQGVRIWRLFFLDSFSLLN